MSALWDPDDKRDIISICHHGVSEDRHCKPCAAQMLRYALWLALPLWIVMGILAARWLR